MATLRTLEKIEKVEELRVGIALPSENKEKPEERWPVLCFLHGRGESGNVGDDDDSIEKALIRHGPLGKMGSIQNGKIQNAGTWQEHDDEVKNLVNKFIVVVPQFVCPPGTRPEEKDIWHTYAPALKTLVETIWKNYQGDKSRTYLSGFSYGGNGVFDMGLDRDHEGLWAAYWAVDPTRSSRNP